MGAFNNVGAAAADAEDAEIEASKALTDGNRPASLGESPTLDTSTSTDDMVLLRRLLLASAAGSNWPRGPPADDVLFLLSQNTGGGSQGA
jgi:hypothetical protein